MKCLAEDWLPAEPLAETEIGALPTLAQLAEVALRPADPADFAVAIDGLLEWADLCGMVTLPVDPAARGKQVRRIVGMYHDDLAHLPPDVLVDALKSVRQRHKWQKLPTPADILGEATAELERRRMIHRRAQAAANLSKMRDNAAAQRNEQRDRERAELAAAIAAQGGGGVGINRVPKTGHLGEHGPEIKRPRDTRPYTPDQLAASREAMRLLADKKPYAGYVPPHERGAE
jgi:hypothetical protein